MEFFIGRNKWTDALILNEHYSHRLPANTCLCVGIRHKNKIQATCYFTNTPMGRWKEPLIELIRLVRLPGLKINLTQLISFGMKELKKRGHDLVISYSDYSQDHHGGIYQASSFNYHGKRNKRLEGYKIDGIFYPTRTYNNLLMKKYGTCSKEVIKDKNVIPFYGDGKFLYWKALNKNGKKKAQRLKLEIHPYPKPGKNKKKKEYQKEAKKLGSDKMKTLF